MNMMTRSLRFRLILWYALGLALVFAVAGSLLYGGVRHYLETSISQTQLRRADRIASLLPVSIPFPIEAVKTRIAGDFAPEATNRFIRITDRDGHLLYESLRPADNSFNPEEISPAPRQRGTRREKILNGAEIAVGTVVSPGGAFVESGESLAPEFKELGRLVISLMVGFAIVAAVALAGGFLLVRRALVPVEEIIVSAENITSRNLSERLPVPTTDDEFKHLSESLNRMITRLDEAFQHNRRFLADASHELRTPLTILRSELEEMLQRDDLQPDLRANTATLFEEVERLVLIVETLFALSRLDTGEGKAPYARFDLAKLVATTAEQMSLLAEDKGITVKCEALEPLYVEGERSRLKQVAVNLLDNAIKYTPSGGAITLRVSRRGEEAWFEVADTGIGIPADAVPRVFDRFFRVDHARSRDAGGAGIGLAIVKAICVAHEGGVDARSELDVGSTFTVRLPLSRNNASL